MTCSAFWLLTSLSTLDVLRSQCHGLQIASFGGLVGFGVIHLLLLVETFCFGNSLIVSVVEEFATLSVFDDVLPLHNVVVVRARSSLATAGLVVLCDNRPTGVTFIRVCST
jgi:hypothetical protein